MSKIKLFCCAITIIINFTISVNVSAQPLTYERTFGNSNHEFAIQLISCADGGFLALSSGSLQGSKAYAIRLDLAGNILWQKSFDDTAINWIRPKRVIQTRDMGFCILFNPIHTVAPQYNFSTVVKLDPSGQLIWATNLDGQQDYFSLSGSDLIEGGDSCIYITGQISHTCSSVCPTAYFISKLQSNGDLQWYRTSAASSYYFNPPKIAALTDTTFALAINIDSTFNILQMDSSGNTLQAIKYGVNTGVWLQIKDFLVDSTGFVSALLIADDTPNSSILCKLNQTGMPIAALRAVNSSNTLYGVQLISADTGYIALLKSNITNGIILTDWSDGSSIPNAMKVGTSTQFAPHSIVRKSDGSLFVFGSNDLSNASTIHLVKTDISTGNILPYSGCSSDTTSLLISPYTLYAIPASFNYSPGTVSYYQSLISDTVSFLPDVTTCFATGIATNKDPNEFISSYPNPADRQVTIKFNDDIDEVFVIIYNQFGKEIVRQFNYGNMLIDFTTIEFAQGMYFYSIIENGERKAGGKFIVQH